MGENPGNPPLVEEVGGDHLGDHLRDLRHTRSGVRASLGPLRLVGYLVIWVWGQLGVVVYRDNPGDELDTVGDWLVDSMDTAGLDGNW